MTAARATEANGRQLGAVGRVALAGVVLGGLMLASADPFTLVFYGSYAATAAILIVRRPANSIGWVLLVIAFGFVGTTSRPDVDLDALQAGTSSMRDFVAAWLNSWTGSAGFVGFLALTLLFPTGRLPDGRWRRVAQAMLGLGILVVALSALAPTFSVNPDGGARDYLVPNRFAVVPDAAIWDLMPPSLYVGITVLLLGSGVVGLVLRYRRSTGVVRLQMRWLVSAAAFVVGAVLFGLTTLAIFDDRIGGIAWIPAIVAYPTVPVAIGVAVLRYRLYEIDRIISRTISWALTTGFVGALFAGLIVALQALLAPVTSESSLAVAGSTLAAAAVFNPVRRRIQSNVDHRFNRSRYDAERALAELAAQLRDETDLARVGLEVETVIRRALAPSRLAVWTRR